jgi:hypothetical protein
VTVVKRIDVHHYVATEHNPLYDVPADYQWWTVDSALRVMDENAITSPCYPAADPISITA